MVLLPPRNMIAASAVVATGLSSLWQPFFFFAGAFSFISCQTTRSLHRTSPSALHGGVGVANTYKWKEEQFEIEVIIPVPPKTSAKNIKFKCSSEGIDLRLNSEEGEGKILLDGTRKMRGKICVDGTFWSIADATNKEADGENSREITVTIEKHFVPVSTIGGQQTYDAVTDFDWGGVYPNDEDEVTHRKYEEPEELDVREYAAKLGVDIDNLDMSKVDKRMFGAGLSRDGDPIEGNDDQDTSSGKAKKKKGLHFDIEQATLDQLTRSGLAKEIVQQADGTEYSLDDETEFSMLGKDILSDELRAAGIVSGSRPVGSNVPDVWQQSSVPVEEVPGYQKTYDVDRTHDGGIIVGDIVETELIAEDDSNSDSDDGGEGSVLAESELKSASLGGEEENDDDDDEANAKENDPIDKLTVAKLKEILKAQNLKTSGTKQILRDRLRNHVDELLKEE
ncbi:hypothetical protein ACHAXM_003888 [Skeletonema potamos]